MKRIFNRKSHSCLSSDNKPKVVEVLLKFSRLYDNINFTHLKQNNPYFDYTQEIDFMSYHGQNGGITDETYNTIVSAVNRTPINFVPPSDDVIMEVVEAVDR